MSARLNSNFLTASVNEFIQVWALGGTASLNLATSNGQATVSFICTLGPPGAPPSLPPSVPASTPHRQPRHRGPAELERNRQCAARYQAAKATASATSPSSVTAPVTPMAQSLTASDNSTKRGESKQLAYKCNLCEFESALENDVSIHIEYGHRKGYNETDLETNLADKIPQIDGKVDDETAEEEAQVKELIEYHIELVKNKKLKNMSEK